MSAESAASGKGCTLIELGDQVWPRHEEHPSGGLEELPVSEEEDDGSEKRTLPHRLGPGEAVFSELGLHPEPRGPDVWRLVTFPGSKGNDVKELPLKEYGVKVLDDGEPSAHDVLQQGLGGGLPHDEGSFGFNRRLTRNYAKNTLHGSAFSDLV